jgi:hypothetical protein
MVRCTATLFEDKDIIADCAVGTLGISLRCDSQSVRIDLENCMQITIDFSYSIGMCLAHIVSASLNYSL